MAVNVNKFNQHNNYGRTVSINREWSTIEMNATTVGTGYVGYIIPVMVREMIPGQTIKLNSRIGVQFTPMVSNVMHNFYGTFKDFFVPCRIIDENWEDFIMGGGDGGNTYELPYIDLAKAKADTSPEAINQSLVHTLLDYIGYPINNDFQELPEDNATMVKALAYPIWAYNKVYNDHYRNPDIQPDEIVLTSIEVQKALWQFDYFTRGQVYQQRGAVPIVPLSGAQATNLNHIITTTIGLKHDMQSINNANTWNLALLNEGQNGAPNADTWRTNFASAGNDIGLTAWDLNTDYTFTDNEGYVIRGNINGDVRPLGNGGVNTSSLKVPIQTQIADHELNLEGTGINLNDLMASMGIMAVLINNAKMTYRYIDFLEIRYGIKRQDARLQMSEYLGTQEFQISSQGITQLGYGDVAQGQTPQGYITSQATGHGGAGTTYEAQEHGYLIRLIEIKPASVYCQGLPRLLQTKTRFEFATPELTNMPDRETYVGELFYTQTAEDAEGFNWTGVYNEYRTMYNNVVGLIRPDTPIPAEGSTLSNGLPSYTLARVFEEAPSFNLEFVQVNADMDRIKQYTEEPDFIYIVENQIETSVPLPLIPNPAQLLNL